MDLVVTPHPVVLENQKHIFGDLRPGESLYAFLHRHVEEIDDRQWGCTIGGREVPMHLWHHTYPKPNQLIELRATVGRNVLYIVAIAVIMYFTWGAGGAAAAGGGWAAGLGATGAFLAYTAVFIAGTMLVNKVLGPKVDNNVGGAAQRDSVYNIGAARNAIRQYEPLPLLLGSLRIAPDYASQPYSFYGGNDQYVVLLLTPGVNVDRVETIYNNDTAIDSYDGVSLFYNGFSGMPDQNIPVMTNVDTVNGGTIEPAEYVTRTTSPDTVQIIVDFEYIIFSTTDKGKPRYNSTMVTVNYRPVGDPDWDSFGVLVIGGSDQTQRRRSLQRTVPAGQYEVRVTRTAPTYSGQGSEDVVNWTMMRSSQPDDATYTGIPRIGLILKATGQLNGYPDELRTVAHAKSMPIWTGTEWATATTTANGLSNPGAQLLQYARGFYATDPDDNEILIGGIGLPDYMIDIAAFQGFMLHCDANDYTYDNYIKDARNHQDVCDAIALAGMGQVTWANGRFSVAWASQEQPLTGVVNMATIKRAQFQVDYTLADAADGIEYSFYDRTSWETKTLRVPAPGVTTMLKPARITGEGVTTEAHAAKMARYHLGQSLYQFKDITYDTDLEHMSYRRMSVLALQHDLTKWGQGGRVTAAEIVAGLPHIHLDEPVAYPTGGSLAYIGLRIPGEKVYRVFQVQPFIGETTEVVLNSAWPVDAPLPGNTAGNPAHDTIWIYDFKSTPGYRVRVVSIAPQAGLKGATIAVVPEPEEFWTYVETGEYIPPPIEEPVETKPIASNLTMQEIRIVQGNVIATDIAATFDVTGLMDHADIYAALGDNEFEQVATTTTRSARWSVDEPGTYNVLVRPFDADGNVGGVAIGQITTSGAATPPTNVDTFDVQEQDGGIRKYTWAFLPITIIPADLAGVEIRYVSGHIGAPVWEAMLPVGDDGFFTSAFESVEPVSGDWTFAIRTRNTYGSLSSSYLRIFKTLGGNLGEQVDDIKETTDELIEGFNEQAAQLELMASELAQHALDIADLESAINAPDYSNTATYATGDVVRWTDGHLYVAKQATTGNAPPNPTYWEDLGEYSSLVGLVSANSVAISNLETSVTSLDGQVTALATAVNAVEAELDDKADASAVTALEGRVTTAEGNITAQGTAITTVSARVGDGTPDNLVKKSTFDDLSVGTWSNGATSTVSNLSPVSQRVMHIPSTPSTLVLENATFIEARANEQYEVELYAYTNDLIDTSVYAAFGLRMFDKGKASLGPVYAQFAEINDFRLSRTTIPGGTYTRLTGKLTLSNNNNIAWVKPSFGFSGLNVGFLNVTHLRIARIDNSTIANASATTALDTRVTTAEGTITAQGTAITNVQVSLRPSPNLLYNPTGGNGFNNWNFIGTSGSIAAIAGELFGKFGSIFRFGPIGSGVAYDIGIAQPQATAVSIPTGANRVFTLSGDMFWHPNSGAAAPYLQIRWLNASGVEIDTGNRPTASALTVNSWTRPTVTGTSPTGTVRAMVLFRQTGTTTGANFYAGVCNIKFEQGSSPTPYSDDNTTNQTASATQSLEARATTLENGQSTLFARYTVVLNVNGYISGIRSENTGNTSTFDVMAANFRILDPSGGARFEYSNGNGRVYDASNVLRVRWGVW